MIELAIGDMNITSGILRGGATLDENTSKGGTFGTVSIGRHTYLSTEPAMNEGNIRDVLISPNADSETKQLVAEYLISRKQNVAPASAVTSVNSAAATGNKDSIPNIAPTKTGVDNIVDKAAEALPPVVDTIGTHTANVIADVSDDVKEGATTSITSFWENIKDIVIILLAIASVIAVTLYVVIKRKNSKAIEQIEQIQKEAEEAEKVEENNN